MSKTLAPSELQSKCTALLDNYLEIDFNVYSSTKGNLLYCEQFSLKQVDDNQLAELISGPNFDRTTIETALTAVVRKWKQSVSNLPGEKREPPEVIEEICRMAVTQFVLAKFREQEKA